MYAVIFCDLLGGILLHMFWILYKIICNVAISVFLYSIRISQSCIMIRQAEPRHEVLISGVDREVIPTLPPLLICLWEYFMSGPSLRP